MPVYILDTNIFIQAYRVVYPLDVATTFWAQINILAQRGHLISIDKVENELFTPNPDPLQTWCKDNLPTDFFVSTANSQAMACYSQVVNWVYSKAGHYRPAAINEFLGADEADAFLVAYALADRANRVIVTQETSDPLATKRVKIPEPCNHFGVRFVNTVGMFRELGATF
jgi:hypothetical protein